MREEFFCQLYHVATKPTHPPIWTGMKSVVEQMPAFYEPICRLQRAESHASLLKRAKLCQNYITCSLLNLLSSFFILQVENQKLSLSKSLDRERSEKENKCKLSDDNDALRHQVVLLEKKIGKSNTFFLLFFSTRNLR